MDKMIWKAIIGSLIGISASLLVVVMGDISPIYILLGIVWGIGVSNSFSFYYGHIPKLNSLLKIGALSLISFQSGVLVPLILIAYLLFFLVIGWIYGWYLLIIRILH